MAWNWIITFLPLATEIVDGIGKVIKNKEKRKKVEDELNKTVLNLYKGQFSSINRDISIIKGWKPIVARIQAIDVVLNRWEEIALLGEKFKKPELVKEVINKKSVQVLIKELSEVKKIMDKVGKEANISWDEGGWSLRAALETLEDKLQDLSRDLTRNSDNFIDNLLYHTRQGQEETIRFFAFWDKILKELVNSSAEAIDSFEKRLKPTLKGQIEKIKSDYPSESWSSLVKGVLNKVSELDPVQSEDSVK